MSKAEKAAIVNRILEEEEAQKRQSIFFDADFVLADALCEELRERLQIETASFNQLTSIRIEDDACVEIIIPYLWRFHDTGFVQQLITQHFWRRGNQVCSDFLEAWTKHCIEAGQMNGMMENTLDNAFIHIQDRRKAQFYVELMQAGYDFPFTMEMLGRWRVPAALPVILGRISDPNYLLPQNAICALGWYMDSAHLPILREWLEDGGPATRKAAATAIRRIESRSTRKPK